MFRISISTLALVVFSSSLAAQKAEPVTVEHHSLSSKILNEERSYSVSLPDSCTEGGASAPCPVLYIVDGEWHFDYMSPVVHRMSFNSQIPAMILVAIHNAADRSVDLTPTPRDGGIVKDEDGNTDMSGKGQAFLTFIGDELIPEVERRYSVMPYRILVGHSLGGLFSLYGLIERPQLFQAHIAIDPSLWWDDQNLTKRAEVYLAKAKDIRSKIYISVAKYIPRGEMNDTFMETSSERFAYALEANPSPHLKSGIRQYPRENHLTIPLISLYDGLLFIFDGYWNPPAAVTSQGIDAVAAFYKNYLGPYGIDLAPTESVLITMGRIAQGNNQPELALEIYKYGISRLPQSSFLNLFLAGAYRQAGEKDLAIETYLRVLELDPSAAPMVNASLGALGVENE